MIPWLRFLRANSRQQNTPIEFAQSREWSQVDGRFVHKTGGFFSVEGLRTRASMPVLDGCEQPIINQPEIGILGFIVCADGAEHRWLLQAKGEPGNTLGVQLAPTVQATYSNYMRRHGGAPTHYLDHFLGEGQALADSLQSEQGTRFLRKFNRNMTVRVPDRIEPASDNFGWCSSSDLRDVLLVDYAINTDARSVIATGPWQLLGAADQLFTSQKAKELFGTALEQSYRQPCRTGLVEGFEAFVAHLRVEIALEVESCSLESLGGWLMTKDRITSREGLRELVVEHFEVVAPDRERSHWDQPLLRSTGVDDVVLLCQMRDGVLQFLLRPALEPGLTGGAEVGPSFKRESARHAPDWLVALVDGPSDGPFVTVAQSDEGGRFMESRCQYRVQQVPDMADIPDDAWNRWVSLSELEALCRAEKLLTNEARSVISVILGLA